MSLLGRAATLGTRRLPGYARHSSKTSLLLPEGTAPPTPRYFATACSTKTTAAPGGSVKPILSESLTQNKPALASGTPGSAWKAWEVFMVSVLAGATSAAWIWQSNHTHRTQNEASAETATVPTCFSIVQRGAHNHWTVKNLKESADASDTRPTNQEDLQPEGGDYAAQGKHYDVSPYETHQQATACSLVRPHTGTPIHGRPVLWITLLARQSTRSLDSPRLLFFSPTGIRPCD